MSGQGRIVIVGAIALALVVFMFMMYGKGERETASVTTSNDMQEVLRVTRRMEESIQRLEIELEFIRDSMGGESEPATSQSSSTKKPSATALTEWKPTPVTIELSSAEQSAWQQCKQDPRGMSMDWNNFAGPQGHNGDIRFEHDATLTPSGSRRKVAIEVGGNIGVDAEHLISRYDPELFVFEPIPKLCEDLKKKLKEGTHVYCYGLGGERTREEKFYLREDPTHSQGDVGSFKGKDDVSHIEVTVQIKDFLTAMRETGLKKDGVDLLTMNCEGCEFELLEFLFANGLIANYKEIQIAWHPIHNMPTPMERYCRLRTLLERTHNRIYSFWYNWESYVRK